MFSVKTRLGAVVAAGAAVATVLAGAGPAHAARTQVPDASGNTIVKLSPQVVKALVTTPCGAFTDVTTNGGASVALTPSSALKLTFPITKALFNFGTGAFRIVHSGSIEVANACYDLKFSNLYAQNLGPIGLTSVQVLAKTKTDGVSQGRTEAFTLDFSGATNTEIIKNNGKVFVQKIRSLDLLLGQEGADGFNNLLTGSSAGPLYPGEQVGKSRISLRLPTS